MARSIEFNFSQVFDGIVWNSVVSVENGILVLEIRNTEKKRVSFSALKCETGELLCHDVVFDEPWWVNLSAAAGDVALFTIYLETNNPDKKGIFAYQLLEKRITWWNNDFSIVSVSGDQVRGTATKYGHRATALSIRTGLEVVADDAIVATEVIQRPHQYLEDNAYFATVKTFLAKNFNLTPIAALEYLEYDSLIFISFYIQEAQLANYLLIMSTKGEVVMREKLDEHLKGIGLDTFFVFGGCVFFVKNKGELFSYKIV